MAAVTASLHRWMEKNRSNINHEFVQLISFSRSIKEKTITDLSPDRHNEYYQKGCDLIQPFMVLHGKEIKPTRKKKIEEGIMYLDAVTKINPDNSAAFWIKGKAYQVLDDSSSAYSEFISSYT